MLPPVILIRYFKLSLPADIVFQFSKFPPFPHAFSTNLRDQSCSHGPKHPESIIAFSRTLPHPSLSFISTYAWPLLGIGGGSLFKHFHLNLPLRESRDYSLFWFISVVRVLNPLTFVAGFPICSVYVSSLFICYNICPCTCIHLLQTICIHLTNQARDKHLNICVISITCSAATCIEYENYSTHVERKIKHTLCMFAFIPSIANTVHAFTVS